MSSSISLVSITRKTSRPESAGWSHSVPNIRSRNEDTIALIRDHYVGSGVPWLLGFSGGKDSTALLKLTYAALKTAPAHPRPVTVVYCDTGVEVPPVRRFVARTLQRLRSEACRERVPLLVRVAQPRLSERFFVKVIGRGYPPPSNKFRWCTDRLRIAPVRRVLDAVGGERYMVLLGIRSGESLERDRTITRHRRGDYLLRQAGRPQASIFAPILDYSMAEVWSTIHELPSPRAVDSGTLTALYRQASGECPIVRDPKGTPCGKGRFGCWTCTVVRQDRAVRGLVEHGHEDLQPLLRWRNWLLSIRDDPDRRCRRRRNGARGMGPFTLAARRELLRGLLQVQRQTPWTLIRRDELREIRRLWRADRTSSQYTES